MRAAGALLALWLGLLASVTTLASETAPGLACDAIEIYTREGCPHCRDAKLFIEDLQQRLPGLRVHYRDVVADAQARADFEAASRSRHIRQPGVPTFVFCNEVVVGFESAATTGTLIEAVLRGELASVHEAVSVRLPLLGSVNPSALGLPLFTIAIGLLDGFNPCAMWVLLFLLSMLVHVKSRARILAIAGTFVLISGLVYFAFMAAWLNVFFVIGYSRGLQISLGAFALLIGTIHIKDFFLLHQGISLSIPESVKPTIYQHVRRVIRAENLLAAVLGASLVALLVNMVELLCTAGLPALYTQILSQYPLDNSQYYGYLALYNVAYMFDDAIMVGIAVVTLGQRRLQERQGRWLKLLSGAIIVLLGLMLIIAPQWLLL